MLVWPTAAGAGAEGVAVGVEMPAGDGADSGADGLYVGLVGAVWVSEQVADVARSGHGSDRDGGAAQAVVAGALDDAGRGGPGQFFTG